MIQAKDHSFWKIYMGQLYLPLTECTVWDIFYLWKWLKLLKEAKKKLEAYW